MGERLEIFIDFLGMKKKDFAESIGILQPHLSPYIGKNAKLPKTEVVVKIAAMGLNVHWWVTGEGEIYANNAAGRELRKKHAPESKLDENTVATIPVVNVPRAKQTIPDNLREIESDIKSVLLKIQSMLP